MTTITPSFTDLAESGEAYDETIQDLAGHVSKQMLKLLPRIRMEAKRRAVDSLVNTAKKARIRRRFR
jgi:hypothetical protein